MNFTSFEFLGFMLMIVIGMLCTKGRARTSFLAIASYIFYGAYEPYLCLLLLLSTVVDWNIGKKLATTENKTARKWWLIASLALNLGLLAVFKYGNFAMGNMTQLANWLGIESQFTAYEILLPPGISFYTFQTLSYTIDIYRRKLEPYHEFSGF